MGFCVRGFPLPVRVVCATGENNEIMGEETPFFLHVGTVRGGATAVFLRWGGRKGLFKKVLFHVWGSVFRVLGTTGFPGMGQG